MKRFALIQTLLAMAAALVALPSRADTNDLAFSVTPYLWVAGIELDSNLPDQPGGSGVERFDTRISAGAMLSGQVRYRSVGVFADFAWLQLKTDSLSPGPAYSEVALKSDFIHTTAALSYQLPDAGRLHSELLVGARLWHVANEFDASAGLLSGFSGDADKTWVDPMFGANLSYYLGKNWSFMSRGFIGGFGASADIAGEVVAGVNWRCSERCIATLGYRYLHEEYDRGGFSFQLDAQGFLLGVGFQF